MRGHWQGGALRKMNHHWQGAIASTDKVWDGSDNLVPTDCIFAPFYGVFVNGSFLGYTDVTALSYQQSSDPDLQYAKLDVEVKPYIPRITDGYYDWDASQGTQSPLQWLAHPNGCVIRRWDVDNLNYTDIGSIPAGTDFSSEQFDLIKPEYDCYILKGRFDTIGYSRNIKTLYDSWSNGSIRYDFRATKVQSLVTSPHNYIGLYGLFGEEPKGASYQYNTTALLEPMFLGYSVKEFKNIATKFVSGGTPPTSPTTQVSWSGKQYPSIWHTGVVNQLYQPYNPHNLPGFIYPNNAVVNFVRPNSGDLTYCYAQVFILKKLKKIRGTITG